MTETTIAQRAISPAAAPFQTSRVLVIAGGHMVHDLFTSFLSPLLPLIINKLSLSLTLAGVLASLQQFPSLINPLLGLLADRGSLRWLVILSPAVTATAMLSMGLAPGYAALVILLTVAGISTAIWHTPTPALVARASGQRMGQGMSFFMLGGAIAYTVGPLLAVAAVAWWGLEGIWRLVPLGVAASAVLYWQTRDMVGARPAHTINASWGETWQELGRVLLPLTGIITAQGFMTVALSTFLPTFLSSEGATLWLAGGAVSIVELAGAGGALAGGILSDRLGRRRVLALALLISPVLMLAFLSARGWLIFPALLAVGVTTLSTSPVMMALVQESSRNHPATANGLYMTLSFAGRSLIIIAVGALADRFGLRATY